ncbi:MAG TPA: type II toxin-antitoxin system VapB family antitoxin [Terriglobales bacterium]|nr:type II toxin-antitoxin system VapB family antitoxin [Terriglobales bacterium]
MKTTIEIPDSLFHEARLLAQKEKTTLKALVEQGLRRAVAQRKMRGEFHLRDASFKGKGLQPEVAGASWEHIRDRIYEGRGA